MAMLTYKKNGLFMRDVDGLRSSAVISAINSKLGYSITFQCHNVTIMKNSQGDRVVIQEVK